MLLPIDLLPIVALCKSSPITKYDESTHALLPLSYKAFTPDSQIEAYLLHKYFLPVSLLPI